ncbi:MAG: GGDEF domain-containing protein [Salibaculum sp.]|uniref:GGDEF domain-containing protein n=1 Tax=Salibaculum sp. TaxID=2855480 RepID=UPI0028700A63|nr:GGDEF domain-containing protein [Salibaculum sp.]MDR9426702.1 GGDEF domain-containing protein [Salibaculum sp.]MDR9481688.1 GGDEF domain-containing protein [Salibaculum sp.]
MMHRLYRFLGVNGPGDFILKFLMFCAMIVALNYGFHLLWPGIGRFDHWFIIANGVCVGGPFVGLFFLLVRKQMRLQRELSTRSRTDDLIRLSNRRFFLKQVGALLEDGIPGILLIMDADHFKAVNDTYGHQVGDACLVSIGYRLTRALRTDDVIGRIGGEEFGVSLANTAPTNTGTVCRDLLMPIPFDGGAAHPHLTITLSMGAVEARPGMSLDALMRAADEALYRAKTNGRARLEFASRLANADDHVIPMPAPDPHGPTELRRQMA